MQGSSRLTIVWVDTMIDSPGSSITQQTSPTLSMDTHPGSNTQFQLSLPPGFRFHPSDEELIIHYLRKKAASTSIPASIIAEIDLYKYNPWELPTKALFGYEEWYFFTPRERKYPNGLRPNRAAASGYWKATGTDKPILTPCGTKSIGVKKALVFYTGRPPQGVKTDWIMHEFRLLDPLFRTLKQTGSMRLDDWVLCRVRQKSSIPKNIWEGRNGPSNETASSSPREDKAYPMTTKSDVEMINTHLYNDCPHLPHIIASQDFSTISYEGRKGSKSYSFLVCSDKNSHHKDLQAPISNSLLNPLKRKPIEGNQDENLLLPGKKLNNGEDRGKILLLIDSNEMNSCGIDRSEDNNFIDEQRDSISHYQELGHMAFTES